MTTDQLKKAFIEKYGEGEIRGYFSPGRVNLIGEHTDYNGGFVFPCALSFGIFCLVRKTERKSVRFASLNMPFEAEVSLTDLNKAIGREWVNYPIGVFAQFMKRNLTFSHGLDLLFYGNVPTGAGLSSSAALEVATGVMINDIFSFGLGKTELALMGQKAEHEYALVNCGIMDQFVSAHGEKDHAVFLNCDTLEFDLVPVQLDGVKIVISNTNSPHKLDSGKYNERVAECQAAVQALQPYHPIKTLGELSVEEFEQLEGHIRDLTVRGRARHVVTEIRRTEDAVVALRAGDLTQFGKLMNGSHDSLRDDYEVTGPELDTMVEEGRKIDGVIGTRMTGGGFGGCTVSLVREEAVAHYIDQVGHNYAQRTGLQPLFYVAEIGDGGKRIF